MRRLAPFLRYSFLLVSILLAASATPAQTKADALAQVKAALDAQVESWNKGSIEESSSVYYNSPDMLWVNRTGIRKGNTPVQASYKRAAATANPVTGIYSYEPLQLVQLSPNCVYFVIKWKYEQRGRNTMNGVTSLVWKKINKKWVIVAEHAS